MISYRPLYRLISLSFCKLSIKGRYYLEPVRSSGIRVVAYIYRLSFLLYQYYLCLLPLAILIYNRTTFNITSHAIKSILQPLIISSAILFRRTFKTSYILSLYTQIYSSRLIYRSSSVYIQSIVISSSDISGSLAAPATYTTSSRSPLYPPQINLQLAPRLYLYNIRENRLQPRIRIYYSSLMSITQRPFRIPI